MTDLMRDPQWAFIKQIQAELQRQDKRLADKEAFLMACSVFKQHLADSRVEFGHPDYTWDRHGAIELAHAYEIEHWETNA